MKASCGADAGLGVAVVHGSTTTVLPISSVDVTLCAEVDCGCCSCNTCKSYAMAAPRSFRAVLGSSQQSKRTPVTQKVRPTVEWMLLHEIHSR